MNKLFYFKKRIVLQIQNVAAIYCGFWEKFNKTCVYLTLCICFICFTIQYVLFKRNQTQAVLHTWNDELNSTKSRLDMCENNGEINEKNLICSYVCKTWIRKISSFFLFDHILFQSSELCYWRYFHIFLFILNFIIIESILFWREITDFNGHNRYHATVFWLTCKIFLAINTVS